MKIAGSLIVALLSLLFISAGSRHQAFGPIKFGMTQEECTNLISQLRARKKQGFDATDLRNHFVCSNTKRQSSLITKESGTSIRISYEANPRLTRLSAATTAETYDQFKQAWEVMRETADCKFKRVGDPAELPSIDEMKSTPGGIVTDTWEMDGITVKLHVYFFDAKKTYLISSTGEVYEASLRATDTSDQTKK